MVLDGCARFLLIINMHIKRHAYRNICCAMLFWHHAYVAKCSTGYAPDAMQCNPCLAVCVFLAFIFSSLVVVVCPEERSNEEVCL